MKSKKPEIHEYARLNFEFNSESKDNNSNVQFLISLVICQCIYNWSFDDLSFKGWCWTFNFVCKNFEDPLEYLKALKIRNFERKLEELNIDF